MYRLPIIFIAFLIFTHPAFATEIYNWHDTNDVPNFGDQRSDIDGKLIPQTKTNTFTNSVPEQSSIATKPLKQNEVTLYTTSWCGFCQKARTYFRKKGIKFTEYDIEKNSRAAHTKRLLDKKYQGRGVPLAIINGKGIHGYLPQFYEKALFQR